MFRVPQDHTLGGGHGSAEWVWGPQPPQGLLTTSPQPGTLRSWGGVVGNTAGGSGWTPTVPLGWGAALHWGRGCRQRPDRPPVTGAAGAAGAGGAASEGLWEEEESRGKEGLSTPSPRQEHLSPELSRSCSCCSSETVRGERVRDLLGQSLPLGRTTPLGCSMGYRGCRCQLHLSVTGWGWGHMAAAPLSQAQGPECWDPPRWLTALTFPGPSLRDHQRMGC